MNKFFKRMLYFFIITLGIIGIGIVVALNLPSIGKNPSGERLERIKKSPNYQNGEFQNIDPVPDFEFSITEVADAFYKNFFVEHKDQIPIKKIPAVKTDLKTLKNNSLVWFGHSSYFLKINDKNILIDPVFHSASPFAFMVKPFDAEYNYSATDLPETIDLLIITHDHYDHLDYELMEQIRPRIKNVLTSLGVGSHLEYWGFDNAIITELDWHEETNLIGMKFTSLPTRHFSGRGLKRAQTLWGAFMLQSVDKNIYIGGDSGYGSHIAEISKKFPNIDLALMENGQYNEDWRYIHFLPEDLRKAMNEIGAKRYFTGHNSKFALARHPWYEPLEMAKNTVEEDKIPIIFPKIGEVVDLDNENQSFEYWWKK